MVELRGAPALVGALAGRHNPVDAGRLWTVSEELTAVTFLELALVERS
ncbi:hypothetical protein ACFV5E_06550 [Streptomyces chartreusis]